MENCSNDDEIIYLKNDNDDEKNKKDLRNAVFWAFQCGIKTSIESFNNLSKNWTTISTEEKVILQKYTSSIEDIYRITAYCDVDSGRILNICSDFKNKFISFINYETVKIKETFDDKGVFFVQFEIYLSKMFNITNYVNCIVKRENSKKKYICYTFIDDYLDSSTSKKEKTILGWIILTINEKTITITCNVKIRDQSFYLKNVQDSFLIPLQNSIKQLVEINKNWTRYYV
jgi:hypothetical protein